MRKHTSPREGERARLATTLAATDGCLNDAGARQAVGAAGTAARAWAAAAFFAAARLRSSEEVRSFASARRACSVAVRARCRAVVRARQNGGEFTAPRPTAKPPPSLHAARRQRQPRAAPANRWTPQNGGRDAGRWVHASHSSRNSALAAKPAAAASRSAARATSLRRSRSVSASISHARWLRSNDARGLLTTHTSADHCITMRGSGRERTERVQYCTCSAEMPRRLRDR